MGERRRSLAPQRTPCDLDSALLNRARALTHKMDPKKVSSVFPSPVAGRTTSAAAAEPQYSCEFGSSKYYALCGLGGVLSCGLTPRSGQVQASGEQGEVQDPWQRLQTDCGRAGSPRPCPWLGPNSHRILHARSLQVRILRGLQERLLRHPWGGEHLLVQDLSLPGSLSICGVLCRHRSLAHGVSQGPYANFCPWYLPHHPEGGRTQNLRSRGIERFLQVIGSIVGQTDSLHHDEVRLLRANS